MHKSILITGGAGFIGANFVPYFAQKYKDYLVINLDALTYAGDLNNLTECENLPNYKFVKGDVCNKKLVETLFEAYKFDYVVNFAAESDVDRSFLSDARFIKTNVHGTLNLLECARRFWVADGFVKDGVKFLQVSTDEVYGSLGLTNEQFVETSPINPQNPYAVTKATADKLCLQFFNNYNLPVNITRCSNNYGPNQHPEKLVVLTIFKCLNLQPIPIHGTGENIRDWIYVTDHCKAIDMVITGGRLGEVYNVGGHNERPNIFIVKSIIEYIKENVDSTVGEHMIKHVTDRKGHDRRYGIDPQKIKDELGWYPETCFEVGIKKTLKWYLDNKEWFDNVTSGAYQKYYDTMYSGKEEI